MVSHNDSVEHEVRDNEDLEKKDTISVLHVDLANSGAVKSDDSDGRVNWTSKQVLATMFLSGLYVGWSNGRNVCLD